MPDPLDKAWYNNPYAPQISRLLYLEEKTTFAGALIGAILYGIVIVLFFQCMNALLDPINQTKRGVNWVLVIHTVVMFSIVTIYTAIMLSFLSVCYIDNREFSGVDGMLPPGPSGYQHLTYFEAINVVRIVMFILNNWLADGLLLYRCYVIYSMNYWAIVGPSLVFLASLATGIVYIHRTSIPVDIAALSAVVGRLGIPHHSISVSLNVLLTLMIVARLALHGRDIRRSMGPLATSDGLYKAIIAMVIESCALFAVTFLLFAVPWAAGSPIANTFFQILVQAQVIAPFLVILQAANRSNGATVYGNTSSIHFSSQSKFMGGNRAFHHGRPTRSVDMSAGGEESSGAGVGVGVAIDPYRDS